MLVAYKRSEVAHILWITERGVDKTNKVIPIMVMSSRSRKLVKRYLLVKELLNEKLIKKAIKEQTW